MELRNSAINLVLAVPRVSTPPWLASAFLVAGLSESEVLTASVLTHERGDP